MNQGDEKLVCRDCNKEFTFTKGEKDFFASRGFAPPSRCPDCRKKKKQSQQNPQTNTHRESSTPGQMHQIVCSSCGKTTEVPFMPRNPHGILCSECFEKKNTATPKS